MATIVELREMSLAELEAALENTREELFNLRFQKATGSLEDYSRMGKVRRGRARILTELHGRQQAIAYAATVPQIGQTLAGKAWQAEAHFDYELSAWVVTFSDAEGDPLASAQVNLNQKRRGARKARRLKQPPRRVTHYEVVG